MRLARWVRHLEGAAQEAAINALLVRRHAVDEGAPQRAIDAGDRLLDAIQLGQLNGARARRKAEAAEHCYSRAYNVAFANRIACSTCGTLVQPARIQSRAEPLCSFCGRRKGQFGQLVAGGGDDGSAQLLPLVQICDLCVELIHDIVGPEPRKKRVREPRSSASNEQARRAAVPARGSRDAPPLNAAEKREFVTWIRAGKSPSEFWDGRTNRRIDIGVAYWDSDPQKRKLVVSTFAREVEKATAQAAAAKAKRRRGGGRRERRKRAKGSGRHGDPRTRGAARRGRKLDLDRAR